MVDSFIKEYVSLIIQNKDKVDVSTKKIDDLFVEVTIKVESSDIGKIIGKNGNMINAIRTILNGCKAKNGISYKIQVLPYS
jgi:predicted RNA-binding protein YlqC (UPF0109 family)